MVSVPAMDCLMQGSLMDIEVIHTITEHPRTITSSTHHWKTQILEQNQVMSTSIVRKLTCYSIIYIVFQLILMSMVESTLYLLTIYAASSELGPWSVAIISPRPWIIVQLYSNPFPFTERFSAPSSLSFREMTSSRLNKIKHKSQLLTLPEEQSSHER